jgi:hypothetical protein
VVLDLHELSHLQVAAARPARMAVVPRAEFIGSTTNQVSAGAGARVGRAETRTLPVTVA